MKTTTLTADEIQALALKHMPFLDKDPKSFEGLHTLLNFLKQDLARTTDPIERQILEDMIMMTSIGVHHRTLHNEKARPGRSN